MAKMFSGYVYADIKRFKFLKFICFISRRIQDCYLYHRFHIEKRYIMHDDKIYVSEWQGGIHGQD